MKTQTLKGLLEFAGSSPGLQPLCPTALGGVGQPGGCAHPRGGVPVRRQLRWGRGRGSRGRNVSRRDLGKASEKGVCGFNTHTVLVFDILIWSDTFNFRSRGGARK